MSLFRIKARVEIHFISSGEKTAVMRVLMSASSEWKPEKGQVVYSKLLSLLKMFTLFLLELVKYSENIH